MLNLVYVLLCLSLLIIGLILNINIKKLPIKFQFKSLKNLMIFLYIMSFISFIGGCLNYFKIINSIYIPFGIILIILLGSCYYSFQLAAIFRK